MSNSTWPSDDPVSIPARSIEVYQNQIAALRAERDAQAHRIRDQDERIAGLLRERDEQAKRIAELDGEVASWRQNYELAEERYEHVAKRIAELEAVLRQGIG